MNEKEKKSSIRSILCVIFWQNSLNAQFGLLLVENPDTGRKKTLYNSDIKQRMNRFATIIRWVENLKIWHSDMPDRYLYGKCYGEHASEVSGPLDNF